MARREKNVQKYIYHTFKHEELRYRLIGMSQRHDKFSAFSLFFNASKLQQDFFFGSKRSKKILNFRDNQQLKDIIN